MKCPKCGTYNSKSSKFCRECGKRLAADLLGLEAEIEEQPTAPVDDAAVAELLDETFRLYDRGRLEAAFAKCKRALQMNPNSPSGHSLLSLIYEKKAEEEAAKGNRAAAEDYLRAAVRQVERVLEANPDSIADRGKLEELRGKLGGQVRIRPRKAPDLRTRLSKAIRSVPAPWLAAGGTFVVMLVVLIVLLRGGGESPAKANQAETQGTPPAQQAQTIPAQPYNQPTGQGSNYQTQPYPAPQQDYAPTPQPYYQPPEAAAPAAPSPPPVSPYPVEQPLSSAPPPERRERVRSPSAPAAPAEEPPSDKARAAMARGDYQSAAGFYRDAIAGGEDTAQNHQYLGMCLYNLGRKSEATAEFQRAVQLYMDQKARGIDAAGGDAGIQTCKQYIELSKE